MHEAQGSGWSLSSTPDEEAMKTWSTALCATQSMTVFRSGRVHS